MNEIFIKAPSTHPFYQRCLDWYKADREVFEKAREYAETLGIPRSDFAIDYDSFGVKDTPEYREKFHGRYKIYGKFLIFKRNTKIGKGWTGKRPMRPGIFLELLDCFVPRFSEVKFICGDTLYARLCSSIEVKVPEGFTEIKGSEFYKTAEDNKECVRV